MRPADGGAGPAGPAPAGPARDDVLGHYAALLPARRELLARVRLSPTPLVDLSAAAPGCGWVHGKVEGENPTGSTKDPMAAVALASLLERGIERFVFTSTGNSAESFAWALDRFPELRATLVVPAGFPAPVHRPANLDIRAAACDYAAAHAAAAAEAASRGAHCEEGFFSAGRREGLKVAYLEALLAMPVPPTAIVQAVSSGMGLLAAARAVDHLRAAGMACAPRLIGVQQESCSPMASAFRDGAEAIRERDKIAAPSGVSLATLLGDPTPSYPHVRRAIRRSGGTMVPVSTPAAFAARASLMDAGLRPCMASSLAFAALDRLVAEGTLGPDDVVLVMLTGGAHSSAGRAEAMRWAARTPAAAGRHEAPAQLG